MNEDMDDFVPVSKKSSKRATSRASAVAVAVKSKHTCASVHYDDVHCILCLPSGTVWSGSKDNCIKEASGMFAPGIGAPRAMKIWGSKTRGYAHWVTCLEAGPGEKVLAGMRDGTIVTWARHSNSSRFQELQGIAQPLDTQCKLRNSSRILCATWTSAEDVLIGVPGGVIAAKWASGGDLEAGRHHKLFKNDWVYQINPLQGSRERVSALAAVGAELHILTLRGSGWHRGARLLKETRAGDSECRPFVSSFVGTHADAEWICACFDSKLRVVDAESLCVRHVRAHCGRVWAVRHMLDHRLLLSSGEEGTVAMWDARTWKQCHAVGPLVGRVSCLQVPSYSPHTFICTTCASDPPASKGSLLLTYDVRLASQPVSSTEDICLSGLSLN